MKLLNTLCLIWLVTGFLLGIFTTTLSAQAAGAVVTVVASSSTVSTASSVTLSFPASVIQSAGILQIVRNTGYTGTAAYALSSGSISSTGSVATSGTENSQILTLGTVTTAGTLNITITGLTTPVAAGNYAWKIYTSAGDFGSNFHYVGQANIAVVRARVPLQLAFVIRDTTDTTATNLCDMGDLSITAIGFCEYRLKITTNAPNGYTINVNTTGNLTNGSANFINATAGAAGTAQVAGTELYGAKITKGSITGIAGTTTLATVYGAGSNNVNYVNTTIATLLTANKPNNPVTTDLLNTTLVRHEASISGSTTAGLYTQTVTYTIAPAF